MPAGPLTARIGAPLAAGLLASLLFLTLARAMPNGPLFGFLAPFPLMLAGLWGGQLAVALGAAAGVLAVGLVEDGAFGLTFLLMTALPALVVTNRALLRRPLPDGGTEWYPAGQVLGALTVTAMALFAVVVVLMPEHPGGVRGWMADTLAHTLDVLGAQVPPGQKQAAAETLAAILPAMVMGGWLVMAVVNAVAAQALLVRLGRSHRPSPPYARLDLPDWLAGVLGLSVVGSALGGTVGYLAANAASVALLPFALLGLAAVHRAIAATRAARLGLTVLYGIVVLASVWMVIPAAALGLVKFVQTRFRRRAFRDGGKEE